MSPALLVSAALWAAAATAADRHTPGLEPLRLRGADGLVADAPLSAETCAACHPAEAAAWRDSRHRQAWTSPLFQAGFAAEPQRFCVTCHAPLAEQAAEIGANAAWTRSQHPTRPGPPADKRPQPLADEGITCAVCHVRDGAVLTASLPATADAAPHGLVAAPEMRTTAFCARCHEFGIPEAAGPHNGLRLTDQLMQATVREWTTWAAGRPEAPPCQGCHMPDGDHRFPGGAHDLDALRAAVRVQAEARDGAARFTVASQGVGHHVPTGDLFRHLTLEVLDGEEWGVVATFGRRFERRPGPDGTPGQKVEAGSTALVPGTPQGFVVPLDSGPLPWRLRYHYGGPHDEARGLLHEDALVVTLAEGVVRP